MTDCTTPRHEAAPEPAAPHAFLCRPCSSGLRRDLRRLPGLYAELGELLDPRRSGGPGTGDGGGLPYHDGASECRSQIVHDTGYWAAEIIRERQPEHRPELSLVSLCEWLADQASWVSYQPWAGDMAGAILADARRAMAVLNPMPRADIPVPPAMNWCPGCHERGLLTAVVSQSDGDRRPSMVWCGGCGKEWDVTQWLRLGREIVRHHEEAAA